jgi:Tfp pilus assembly protein PilF
MALNATAIAGTGTISEALHIAIDAVNRGDLNQGRKALAWVLRQDPNNAVAWLWMACCSPDDASRQECYRRVTTITGTS